MMLSIVVHHGNHILLGYGVDSGMIHDDFLSVFGFANFAILRNIFEIAFDTFVFKFFVCLPPCLPSKITYIHVSNMVRTTGIGSTLQYKCAPAAAQQYCMYLSRRRMIPKHI